MGKITDIQEQKKNKERCSIFIDGDFVCGLDKVTLLKSRVKIGDYISERQLAEIQQESEAVAAFDKAVHFLSFRMRTEKEMRRYLKDKGYVPTVIDGIIVKLKGYHYIDDSLFAHNYVEMKRKKDGIFKIRSALMHYGVNSNVIDEALSEFEPQDDEAYCLIVKYIKSRRTTDKQKIKRYLAGRGFLFDAINAAISRAATEGYFDETNDTEEDYDD